MKTPLQPYSLCWLVFVAISLLLYACQTSDPDIVQVRLSTSTSEERGQELFRTNCALCHGDRGERGAYPLKDAAGQLDDASLAESILNGMPEKGMPVPKKLTNEQIADLMAFIRSWNSQ